MQEAKKRLYRHKTIVNPLQNFLDKVIRGYGGDCWIWGGAGYRNGYGAFAIGRKTNTAHRASYILHKGPIPEGMFICHTCDVKNCVNPDHLWAGDQVANMQDCIRKGRHSHGETHSEFLRNRNMKREDCAFVKYPHLVPRGEKNFGAKLTDDKVRLVRVLISQGERQCVIAKQMGVSTGVISQIRHRKAWSHVDPLPMPTTQPASTSPDASQDEHTAPLRAPC